MAWIWKIAAGAMLNPAGALHARGYSGHGEGIDCVAAIGKVCVGPLPCGPKGTAGEYTLGPLLPNTEPGRLHHLGPNICNLIPSAAQRAFIASLGRDADSFYLHAPVIGEVAFVVEGRPLPTGSEGCICIAEPYRMQILTSADRALLCVG